MSCKPYKGYISDTTRAVFSLNPISEASHKWKLSTKINLEISYQCNSCATSAANTANRNEAADARSQNEKFILNWRHANSLSGEIVFSICKDWRIAWTIPLTRYESQQPKFAI